MQLSKTSKAKRNETKGKDDTMMKRSISPRFTRCHYIEFASIINKLEDPSERNAIANEMSKKFANDNPRYKETTFLEACGAVKSK